MTRPMNVVPMIDSITSFTSGTDELSIEVTVVNNNFTFVSSPAADYDAFLAAATAAITNDGTGIYTREVDGNVYVAVNEDGGTDVDFVVELVGVTTVVDADFTAFAIPA